MIRRAMLFIFILSLAGWFTHGLRRYCDIHFFAVLYWIRARNVDGAHVR